MVAEPIVAQVMVDEFPIGQGYSETVEGKAAWQDTRRGNPPGTRRARHGLIRPRVTTRRGCPNAETVRQSGEAPTIECRAGEGVCCERQPRRRENRRRQMQ